MSETPAPAPVKSGWKTTEHFALMLLLGALAYVLEGVVSLLPQIAAQPGIPAWAVPLVLLAATPLGWVAARAVKAYQEQRIELKLPAGAPEPPKQP